MPKQTVVNRNIGFLFEIEERQDINILRQLLQTHSVMSKVLIINSIRFDLIEWSAYFLREIYLKKIEVKKEILDEFIRKNFANRL